MSSDVYFSRIRVRSPNENNCTKLAKLCGLSGLSNIIYDGDLTAVKIHFGELGNDTYIKPIFVHSIIDEIKRAGGKPFLTDTNTMYVGSRHYAVDHLVTAIRHGFAYAVIDAPLIIADGLKGHNFTEINVPGKHFKTVKIARDIVDSDAMVVLSHVKGHALAGFGGAIKNLAMGCAPPLGKRDQHQGMQAEVNDQLCVGCGFCVTQCPFEAIHMKVKAYVDKSVCYGCSACLQVCPEKAIDFNWKRDVPKFLERMVEYAAGAVSEMVGKVLYISFLTGITPDCDCVPWSDAVIVPDIGFLASTDPVAIDKAAIDLINEQKGLENSTLCRNHKPGEDKFSGIWDKVGGSHLLDYAEEYGLGSQNYTIIEV